MTDGDARRGTQCLCGAVCARRYDRLASAQGDLILVVEALIDFIARSGLVPPDELKTHLDVYLEHHEVEMRDRMAKLLGGS